MKLLFNAPYPVPEVIIDEPFNPDEVPAYPVPDDDEEDD